jgi:hypothetical protein
MRRNTVLEVLSQKDASWTDVQEHLFTALSITNTPLLSDRILGHSTHSGTFLDTK